MNLNQEVCFLEPRNPVGESFELMAPFVGNGKESPLDVVSIVTVTISKFEAAAEPRSASIREGDVVKPSERDTVLALSKELVFFPDMSIIVKSAV